MANLGKRPLGKTGIMVSEIGLGCWGIGGPVQRDGVVSGYGRVDDAESVAMLRRALDQGVNFLDTAPWYGNGHSERLVGEAIRGRREEVILCSKVGIALEDEELIRNYSGDYIMAGYQDALERLGTDYIDVYVLHSPAVEEYDPSGLAALKELKRRGVIRAFGISFPASHQEGEQFYLPLCEREGVDVVQLRFNLVSWAARRTIMPALRALGIGIVCREPFFFGYLTGRFTGRFDRDTVRAASIGTPSSTPNRMRAPPGRGSDTWSWWRRLSVLSSFMRVCSVHLRRPLCATV